MKNTEIKINKDRRSNCINFRDKIVRKFIGGKVSRNLREQFELAARITFVVRVLFTSRIEER